MRAVGKRGVSRAPTSFNTVSPQLVGIIVTMRAAQIPPPL
jgi:hypothetical protein